MKVNKIFLVLFITAIGGLLSCIFVPLKVSAQSKLIGRYRSNFAEFGFFVANLELRADSTFSYRWQGDTMSDEGTGCYKVAKDTIIFSYDPDPNNIFIDDTGHVWETPRYSHHRPLKLLYRRKHLWSLSTDNNIYKGKVKGYFSKKRYWLFGSKSYSKRPFLIKIN